MSTQSYIHRQGRDKAGETDLGTLERIEVVEVEPETFRKMIRLKCDCGFDSSSISGVTTSSSVVSIA